MRFATPDDADFAVPLMIEAIDHLALELSATATHAAAVPFFKRLFAADDSRYSHRFMRIESIDGTPAGILLAYPGAQEIALSKPIEQLWLERNPHHAYTMTRESGDDEFYLDAIAVSPRFRGKGCATRLIDDAGARAKGLGFDRLGLLVDIQKPGVKRLYERNSFVVDGERILAGHRYEHMCRYV
jgi:ribosomal protein S18 acetylase RimI-like enzyme